MGTEGPSSRRRFSGDLAGDRRELGHLSRILGTGEEVGRGPTSGLWGRDCRASKHSASGDVGAQAEDERSRCPGSDPAPWGHLGQPRTGTCSSQGSRRLRTEPQEGSGVLGTEHDWARSGCVNVLGQLSPRTRNGGSTQQFIGSHVAAGVQSLRVTGCAPAEASREGLPASPSFWWLQASWACDRVPSTCASCVTWLLPVTLGPNFPLMRTPVTLD